MNLCKETMIRSYNWTSFRPEQRGESDFNYYTELLKSDLESLGENKGNYEAKFIDKVMTIYHRQSRCASPMIAGPANFPTRSNNKRWASRDNAVNEFEHWRAKYIKAVNRVRTLSPEDEIDKTLEEIETLEEKKEVYKACNKLKTKEEKLAFLEENERLTDRTKYDVENGWILNVTRLTVMIRERRKKLDIMRARIERKETFEKILFNGGYVDIENDRVVIKHDNKPSREVLDVLRSSGFRYSPKTVSWVRKHTGQAVAVAKNILPLIEVSNAK